MDRSTVKTHFKLISRDGQCWFPRKWRQSLIAHLPNYDTIHKCHLCIRKKQLRLKLNHLYSDENITQKWGIKYWRSLWCWSMFQGMRMQVKKQAVLKFLYSIRSTCTSILSLIKEKMTNRLLCDQLIQWNIQRTLNTNKTYLRSVPVLLNLETCCTVILPPMVTVLWNIIPYFILRIGRGKLDSRLVQIKE